jgi:hypothetical protein
LHIETRFAWKGGVSGRAARRNLIWLAHVNATMSNRWLQATVMGWMVGAWVSLYLIPHPLLHSQFSDPKWRAIVLPRVIAGAPWCFVVPIAITLGLAVTDRFGRGTARASRVALSRKAMISLLLSGAVITAADVALLMWYSRLLH